MGKRFVLSDLEVAANQVAVLAATSFLGSEWEEPIQLLEMVTSVLCSMQFSFPAQSF